MKLAVVRLTARFRCSTPVLPKVAESFYTTVRDVALALLPAGFSHALAYAACGREVWIYTTCGEAPLAEVYAELERAFSGAGTGVRADRTIEGYPSSEDPVKDVELEFGFAGAELFRVADAADAQQLACELAPRVGPRDKPPYLGIAARWEKL